MKVINDFLNLPIIVMIVTTIIQYIVQQRIEKDNSVKESNSKTNELKYKVYSDAANTLHQSQEDFIIIQDQVFDTLTKLEKCLNANNLDVAQFNNLINESSNIVNQFNTLDNKLLIQTTYFIEKEKSYNFIDKFRYNIETVLQNFMYQTQVLLELEKELSRKIISNPNTNDLSNFYKTANKLNYEFATKMSNLNTERLEILKNALNHFNEIKFL